MQELISIEARCIAGETIQTVNARDLHEFLGSRQDFSTWVRNRIEKYGFVEGKDFTVHKIMERQNQGLGYGQGRIEYHLALDMAKELAMVENNEKGREARRYFIECERKVLNGSLQRPEYAHLPVTAEQAIDAAHQLKAVMLASEALGMSGGSIREKAVEHVRLHHGIDFSYVLGFDTVRKPVVKPVVDTAVKPVVPSLEFGVFTTSELAAKLGITLIQMQKRLAAAGLQVPHKHGWLATERGSLACAGSLIDEATNRPYSPNLKWFTPYVMELMELMH